MTSANPIYTSKRSSLTAVGTKFAKPVRNVRGSKGIRLPKLAITLLQQQSFILHFSPATSFCIPVSVRKVEYKCFQLAMKSSGRVQQLRLYCQLKFKSSTTNLPALSGILPTGRSALTAAACPSLFQLFHWTIPSTCCIEPHSRNIYEPFTGRPVSST